MARVETQITLPAADPMSEYLRCLWTSELTIYAREGPGQGGLVRLTHEQARELFNWLGIMLHTGGRTHGS